MSYDLVISLGFRCYPAFQLRRMMIQNISMPFDWIVSPASGVVAALETKFEGSLNPENLSGHETYVLDTRFGFQYWHDFKEVPKYMESHAAAVSKRRHLERRFFEILASKRRLLFVRHETPGEGSRDISESIIGVLSKYRSQETFRLVYLSDKILDHESGLSLLVNVPQQDILLDELWDDVFFRVHSRERIKGYRPNIVRAYVNWPRPVQIQASKLIGTFRKRRLQLQLAMSGRRFLPEHKLSSSHHNQISPI